jgi:oxygen-independent coproporphyrinogen-3 oxidase
MQPVVLPLAASAVALETGLPTALLPQLAAEPVSGLYVHIPFCLHKCHYCDFYSITRQSEARMQQFVDLVLQEARLWQVAAKSGGPTMQLRTVFFGGGTPTLLPQSAMQRLLAGLGDIFDMSGVREWTVEANPATAPTDYCRMLRRFGVDRISFGAQSFDTADLQMLERHHAPAEVVAAVEIARDAGFERINIDLIYAVPGQSLASWTATLDQAIALGLDHYSCYGLTYEPNTPLTVRRRLGQFAAAEENLELAMFRHTRRRLADAGIAAYEISNFARPGQACRHNLLYWTGGNYAGLGPAAASHVAGVRFRNRPHLGQWEAAISDGQALGAAAIEVESLTPRQRAGELVMLMLRLPRGIDYDDFATRTGLDARLVFAEPIERLRRIGTLESDQQGFRLSERGLVVADAVAAEFLAT